MKKIITGLLLVGVMLCCTGCGRMYQKASNMLNEKAQSKDTSKQIQEWYNHVEETTSLDEAQNYFDPENDADENEYLYNQVKETGKIDVTSAKIIDKQGKQETVLFHYTAEGAEGESWGLLMCRRNEEEKYVVCQNAAALQEVVNNHLCGNCGGSGQILSGNSLVCAICGGTGQQYIPNLYYDAVMGWTGGYIGCGGCGGSGYTSGRYVTCALCGGCGII